MNHNIINLVAHKSCLEVQDKLSSIFNYIDVSKYTYLIEGNYYDNFGPDGENYNAFHLTNDVSKISDIVEEYLSKRKLSKTLIGSFLLLEQDNPNAYLLQDIHIYSIELNRLYEWEELKVLKFSKDELKTHNSPMKKGNYPDKTLIRGVVFYHPQMPLVIEDIRLIKEYKDNCHSYMHKNNIQWPPEYENLPIERPKFSVLTFDNYHFLNFYHFLDDLKKYINMSYDYLEPYKYGKIDGLKYYIFHTDCEENAEYIVKKNMFNNDTYLYDYTYIKFDEMLN